MAESLDTATGRRIKKSDTFLLYVLLSGAFMFGYGWYGPTPNFPTDSGTISDSSLHTLLMVLAIVVLVLLVIGISLHAVFMMIVQNKINNVRHHAPALPKQR